MLPALLNTNLGMSYLPFGGIASMMRLKATNWAMQLLDLHVKKT
jgi:hypothetical protein